MKYCSLFVLAGVLASCALVEGDEDIRTYPPASSYQLVTISELNNTVPLPGEYNIRGYAVDVPTCPKDVLCIPVMGIGFYEVDVVSPSDSAFLERGIFIAADTPEQFTVGKRYELSVQVEHDRVESAAWPSPVLVGYDRID